MKYRIVGADGKIYGPVSLEQIRQWLADGRIESRTPVHVAGATAWTTVALLPEFAATFAGTPSPMVAPAPIAVATRGTNGFATTALVCALISWVCCCCGGLPFNLLALIFSIIALAQLSSRREPQEGRMLAIVALVLAILNLVFFFGLGLLQAALGSTSINFQTGEF